MKKLFLLFFLLVFPGIIRSQTLDEILSAPYVSDLVRNPDGQQISWVVNERGIRSVYTAKSPDFVPDERFRSPGDDGQVLGNFAFGPHGQNLFFVRGSAPNRQGRIANPSSLASYPETQLLMVHLPDGALDTLSSDRNFVVGSDGSFILVAIGNKLFNLNLGTKQKALLVEMRGTFSDMILSPDGNSVCFVSNRGDHSFVGKYTFEEASISWISPSVHRDQFPVWSPDGTQIAFIRTPGQKKGEKLDITGGNSFSLVVHTLAANSATTLWSSPSDDGGFAQYYHNHPLRWAKSGDLLFYSEHEGWMKIYCIDPKTRQLTNLLPGDCEIEHSDLSPDGQSLVFSSNCGDIDRRHLFEYDLATKQTTHLTSGKGIETDPLSMGSNQVVYRQAYSDTPTGLAILKDGVQNTIYSSTKQDHITPKQVIFQAADGTKVHGQLFTTSESGQKPGLLFMHGGPIRQMLLGYHYSSYYAFAYALNQYLAQQGYVVMSVNYRAGIGYGKGFRRAPKQGPRGASEYQDILAAGQYLQALSYVDADKIGLWGGSYGGLLTAQGLARNSDVFKAGVDFHGVHDWSWRATDFSDGGAWGITTDLLDQAFQSSPAAEVSTWESPVLLIHGDDDRNVMFGQTIDLVERLKKEGVHHEILVFPDEVHGFYRYDSWLRSYSATVDFFDRFLRLK